MAFTLSQSDDDIWKQFIEEWENLQDPFDVTIGGDIIDPDLFSQQFSTFEVPQIPVLAVSPGGEGYLNAPMPAEVPLLQSPSESVDTPPVVNGADPASMKSKDELIEKLSNQ